MLPRALVPTAISPPTTPAESEVAHAIINDLTVMLGLLELLELRGQVPAELQERHAEVRATLEEIARDIHDWQGCTLRAA
jgi:hypothetical protein